MQRPTGIGLEMVRQAPAVCSNGMTIRQDVLETT